MIGDNGTGHDKCGPSLIKVIILFPGGGLI